MDKEFYRQEVWSSIDRTAVNLFYLDCFRDRKESVEPVYRGTLGIAAVITAIISFFDVSILIKISAVITGLLAAIPFFYPVLPSSADFDKMTQLSPTCHLFPL